MKTTELELHALMWNNTMEVKKKQSLHSYLIWCKTRKGAWIPPSNHPAWEMAGVTPP